jgi:hypothetical protein
MVDEPHEKFVANIILVIVYSGINFYILNIHEKELHNKEYTYFDALYYTVITHFTIGFGDIVPKSVLGKSTTMLHIFMVWIINIIPAAISIPEANSVPDIPGRKYSVRTRGSIRQI